MPARRHFGGTSPLMGDPHLLNDDGGNVDMIRGHPLKGLSREKTPPQSKKYHFLIDS